MSFFLESVAAEFWRGVQVKLRAPFFVRSNVSSWMLGPRCPRNLNPVRDSVRTGFSLPETGAKSENLR